MEARLGILVYLLLCCSAALADTHYVNVNNPTPVAPYTSWATAATNIQDAVEEAVDNDRVLVTNGVYDAGGAVTPGYACMNRVVITEDITVQSVNGPKHTLIVGAEATGGGNGPDAKVLWQKAQTCLDRGEEFDLRVSGANRGGLLVEWQGLQGFIPASHLSTVLGDGTRSDRISELAQRIGESLKVRLIEVDAHQQRLVFPSGQPSRSFTRLPISWRRCPRATSAGGSSQI